jgi:pimeloyl-ACP methyl ester carboxylesterase
MASPITSAKMDKPTIVGHSLGGFWALAVAVQYPDLPGGLVIVDSYPFLAGVQLAPGTTSSQAKAIAAHIRDGMSRMTQQAYEDYVKAGTGTEHGDERLGLPAPGCVGSGIRPDCRYWRHGGVFGADLRENFGKSKSPALVMGAWRAYSEYTDHDRTMANLRQQYTAPAGVEVQVNDTAHHFLMWDDPDWMFAQMDRFLGAREKRCRLDERQALLGLPGSGLGQLLGRVGCDRGDPDAPGTG